jgi:Gpi18-like mannosyltransferase
LLLLGLIIRFPFFLRPGAFPDYLYYASWATYSTEHGVLTIYDDPSNLSTGHIDYPPLFIYLFHGLGLIYRTFLPMPMESQPFIVLIKCMSVLFEVLSAFILYHWVAKRYDSQLGKLAFGLFFLNPAIFYVGVVFGQVDAVYAAFLLLSLMFIVEERRFPGGIFLACALLLKLQALPFVPLFMLIPVVKRDYRGFYRLCSGFLLASFLILAPYIITGRLDTVIERCFFREVKWGSYLTVGAFNLWYLHADPVTFDFRHWGWLYGEDGELQVFPFLHLLTYQNLGIFLFALAYGWSIYLLWKRENKETIWLAAAQVALAFYLLPTRVHERYLFPFFLFFVPISLILPFRRILYYSLSVTYLINMMVIYPLVGFYKEVTEIDTLIGVLTAATNLVLYALFLVSEYIRTDECDESDYSPVLQKTLIAGLLMACLLIGARVYERQDHPDTIYLSNMLPVHVQQEWPPIAPEAKGLSAYFQAKQNLSSDNRILRIRDTCYRYGIGAHAHSVIEYDIPADFDYFESYIGVDEEVLQAHDLFPDVATVIFLVYINNEQVYQSPLMIPTSPARLVHVPLPKNGKTSRLRLEVTNGGDTNHSDHANWALARIVREG